MGNLTTDNTPTIKYFIAIGDKQEGPFQLEDLKKIMFNEGTMVWKEGMTEWLEISQIDELRSNIKNPELKKVFATPPPLPNISSNPIDIQDSRNLLLKQKDFKKQIAQSKFNENKEEIIRSVKSNLYILLITIPLTVGAYFLIAYLEGGFKAISLRQQYEPYLNSKLNRDTIPWLVYDKVPLKFRAQLEIEDLIEDLMIDHMSENELTPSNYERQLRSHEKYNKENQGGSTAGFIDGTVGLGYSTFLDDRIDIAFKSIAILRALGIFIFSNLLFFIFQFYRQKKLITTQL